ncbi:LOW QUALITY PROTEIN: WAS/WASL-interacting protein family member 3 [Perca flavescens]|uniref:LOW QUALITY PROTEIN: WAS/WASL-interacting protein family member 3 n=1 Tax=Perca flavescens TaxID=8167 RepID=UPI00106F04DB|nr:LOW QUALITY PROTEIN: WAS/WASL-interacting protein family member 3-like [Perca flavescens]
MPVPPPPPPPPLAPPPPPPPPNAALPKCPSEPPKFKSGGGGGGRNALLADIQKGARLKKVTQVNDRSAPAVDKPKASTGDVSSSVGASQGSSGGMAPMVTSLGGLFAGGFPTLRPTGQRDLAGKTSVSRSSSSASLKPLWNPPTPADTGSVSEPPRTGEHRGSVHRPPVPSSSAPSSPSHCSKHLPSFPASSPLLRLHPPLPLLLPRLPHLKPSRTGRPTGLLRLSPPVLLLHLLHPKSPSPPGSPSSTPTTPPSPSPLLLPLLLLLLHLSNLPLLFQGTAPQGASTLHPQSTRNLLGSPSCGTAHWDLLPHLLLPPSQLLTPPAARPPSPLPPKVAAVPSPAMRSLPPSYPCNAPTRRPPAVPRNAGVARLAPPPAPPARSPSTELTSRIPPPPPPPPLPPSSLRNGHLHNLDDFESKFQFHPVEDFPPPDEFKPFPRIYPSKENRGNPKSPGIRTHLR